MKKILTICIISLFCFTSFAQGGENGKAKRPEDNRGDKIQSEKIAFFTNFLDLTPEEAQAFWPVYNNYTKEIQAAHQESKKALFELRKDLKNNALSNSETEKYINQYVTALEKESSIPSNYVAKFKKILPVKKVSKIFIAEENFRMKLISQFRNRDNDRPENRDGNCDNNRPEKPAEMPVIDQD